MFLYRNILGQAWRIAWRNKYLWFFGLFVALLGNGGELEVIFRSLNGDTSPGIILGRQFFPDGFFSLGTLSNMGNLLVNDPVGLLASLLFLLALLFLSVFLVWLVMVSQAALINNAAAIISGKKHDMKIGINAGVKKLWPVLGLNLVAKTAVYVILAIVGLSIWLSVMKTGLAAASLLLFFSMLCFIPLAIIFSFVAKYAVAYTVIRGNHMIDAIRLGWKLFVKNWLVSLEVAIILLFINFLAGLGLVLIFLLIAAPTLFVALVLAKIGVYFGFWLILMLAFVLFLAIVAAIGAGLASFQTAAWTGLFIELVGRGGMSKIARIFGKK